MSKKARDVQPYWRPDFRISGSLPDIKVVRTDFIINFIAITVLVIVSVFVLQREYRAFSIRGTITDLERRIRVAEADDALHLKQNGRFRTASEQIIELDKFYRVPFLPQQLLMELLELRPKDLIFSSIDYREEMKKVGKKKNQVYTINVSGQVRSLDDLTVFKHSLQESKLLKLDDYQIEVMESDGGRDNQTGIFPCRIVISIVSGAKNEKKAKAGS